VICGFVGRVGDQASSIQYRASNIVGQER